LGSIGRKPLRTNDSGSAFSIPGGRTTGKKTVTIPDSDRAHGENFSGSSGVVYANDLAAGEIKKANPSYPVGSILVREKHPWVDPNSTEIQIPTPSQKETRTIDELNDPEIVIAMVKREKGFSKKTGDWEFFQFKGSELKLELRATKSSCATCHKQVKDEDWVFRTYVK